MNIISKLLDLFDPAGWIFKAVAALVLAGAMWWAWTSFKAWVSAPAVAKAVTEQKAISEPIIKELAQRVADRDATIEAKDAAFRFEATRQKVEAEQKTKLYNEVIQQNAKLSKQVKTSIAAADTVAGQLRDITERAARSSATCTSDSDYPRRLGDALAQCETDLNRQFRATEEAAAIAADALAAARALRN